MFYAEGIHAVGVDRVASEADVAKATLYQHFRSKDELVAACLGLHSRNWRRQIAEPVLAGAGSPATRVARVFDLLGRGFAAPEYRGCPFINAAAEYPGRTGVVAEAIRNHRSEVRNLFKDLVVDLPLSYRRRGLPDELILLYDGALVGAEFDRGARAARVAKSAARHLLAL